MEWTSRVMSPEQRLGGESELARVVWWQRSVNRKLSSKKNVRRYRMVRGMFYAINVMKSLQVG